jgi:hypothetical protein
MVKHPHGVVEMAPQPEVLPDPVPDVPFAAFLALVSAKPVIAVGADQ